MLLPTRPSFHTRSLVSKYSNWKIDERTQYLILDETYVSARRWLGSTTGKAYSIFWTSRLKKRYIQVLGIEDSASSEESTFRRNKGTSQIDVQKLEEPLARTIRSYVTRNWKKLKKKKTEKGNGITKSEWRKFRAIVLAYDDDIRSLKLRELGPKRAVIPGFVSYIRVIVRHRIQNNPLVDRDRPERTSVTCDQFYSSPATFM